MCYPGSGSVRRHPGSHKPTGESRVAAAGSNGAESTAVNAARIAARARGADRDLGGAAAVDAPALAAELRAVVRGEVRFDEGSRALYATDASNYRQVPIGVVLPHDAEDVVAAIAVARRHGAPILPRGGGTSLAGQCCNVAVVLDMSRYMTTILASTRRGARRR